MGDGARERMIVGAMRLLATKGLDATSFGEVLKLTGAPRGSIYHHFPDGKDQLVAASIDLAGAYLVQQLEQTVGRPALEVARHFLDVWRQLLIGSNQASGCAVLAVAIATDSEALMAHARDVFRSWRERLAELLAQGGLARAEARKFATLLVASTEGAVVLSRAERSLEPFETVAAQLLAQLRAKT